jgi:hypothetical protein
VSGYYHNATDSTCPPCSAIHLNCTVCSDAPACTTCNTKFYVYNSSCSACGSNCDVCTDSYTCTTCTDGYYLIGGQCIICSHLNPLWQLCHSNGLVASQCW